MKVTPILESVEPKQIWRSVNIGFAALHMQ